MKKIILKLFNGAALIIFFLSAFSLDSGSWKPTIALAISLAWFWRFCASNNWFDFIEDEINEERYI